MTITIGIDPHQGSDTVVAIDSNEHVLDEIRVRSSPPTASCWARDGPGKTAPNDAHSIAIAALRADHLTTVCADDHSPVLKLLSKRHRDVGRLKNKASCRLHALLLEMVPGGAGFWITTATRINAVIDSYEPADAMGRQRHEIAYELAGDIDRYNGDRTSRSVIRPQGPSPAQPARQPEK
jgi:hypothetical protein